MDIFRTPGASLEGAEKVQFDEIKEMVDGATNDFLVRADWDVNMRCVDAVNSIKDPTLMSEVMFLLRRKLSSKNPQTVGLTMQLIGSMVNNCGARFHAALNEEKVMRDMGNAIRYFGKRPGAENKAVTDVSLDLIQSWGEAFLPRRKQYYNIVDLYFNLRKEGLPFKAQQFDPSRVPIFINEGTGTHDSASDNTDAILAAALQSSMQQEFEAEERSRMRRPEPSGHVPYSDDRRHEAEARRRGSGSRMGAQPAASTAEEVQSLQSCMFILKDLILAATHAHDFRHNEVAQEVVSQLQSYQSKMTGLIEAALMSDPEGVEKLILLNESSQQLCAVYAKLKSGDMSLAEGQRQAELVAVGDNESTPSTQAAQGSQPAPAVAPSAAAGEIDLLGMGDYSPQKSAAPAATVQSPPAPQPPSAAEIPMSPPQPATTAQPQPYPQQAAARIPAPLARPPAHGQSAAHSTAPLVAPTQAPAAQKPSAGGDPFASSSNPLDDLFGSPAPVQPAAATTSTSHVQPPQPADPFAPAAPPVSGMKADPLALFDQPAPVRGGPQAHQFPPPAPAYGTSPGGGFGQPQAYPGQYPQQQQYGAHPYPAGQYPQYPASGAPGHFAPAPTGHPVAPLHQQQQFQPPKQQSQGGPAPAPAAAAGMANPFDLLDS